jgi:REP element-mobilizing transposase RayT
MKDVEVFGALPAGMSALPGTAHESVGLPADLAPLPAPPGSAGIPAGSASPPPRKGWYSRGYLPHRDDAGLVQSITFRLADSFPSATLAEWRDWIDPETGRVRSSDAATRARIEAFLDAGHGECWLRRPTLARLVEEALLRFDGERYRLIAWCVMPNHVHVVAESCGGYALPGMVHSWKSFTASEANREMGRSGAFWYRDYWDRYIRDGRHLEAAVGYVEANPVKAGLAKMAKDWPWGSARRRFSDEEENDG